MDRDTIRNDPPPILVTNVTMLEYMLVRRNDRPLIENSRGKLRWIILDEAHGYVGSAAAEIALLLRRPAHLWMPPGGCSLRRHIGNNRGRQRRHRGFAQIPARYFWSGSKPDPCRDREREKVSLPSPVAGPLGADDLLDQRAVARNAAVQALSVRQKMALCRCLRRRPFWRQPVFLPMR
jgi:hypothetical protein